MTDNNAKFNFYINRQGIRGRKGEKGDTGFSPTVEVNTNTATEYTLKIINEDGEFITDNLRGSAVEDRGGTYMRYDTETQEMYAGNPNSAATNQAGVVIIADQNSIENISGDTVLTPEGFVNNLKTFLKSSNGSVSITQDEEDSKTDLKVDVSGIEGDISGLESRMTGCESAINTIENTTIPAVQRDVDQLETDVSNKVDKVAGKGLSTNDFTNEDSDKLMHAVVDSDLANVAFTGDYDDLTNKPTIPVVPANNLTGDSVDGTSIVYNSETGKISATAQTPDLSNYVDKTTAQTISGAKTFNGVTTFGSDNPITISASRSGASRFSKITGSAPVNHLNTSSSGQVWGFDKDPVYTNGTTGGESSLPSNYQPYLRYGNIASAGGTIIITNNGANGINLEAQGGAQIDDTTVRTDACYSSDKTVDFVTGAIQDALDTVGDEFVAKTDIATSATAGIVKPDGSTITIAADGTISSNSSYTLPTASTSTLGGVKVDGTTVTIDANGVISAAGSAPTNMVTTNTTQTITSPKTFSNSSNTPLKVARNRSNSSNDGYFTIYSGSSGNTQLLNIMGDINNLGIVTKTAFCGGGSNVSTMELSVNSTPSSNSYGKLVLGNNSLQYVKSNNTTVDLLAGSSNNVKSSTITNMVQISQTDYDALVTAGTVDANTFYVIV